MLNSKLYRNSAIQQNTPYLLMIKFYWRSIIGTAGAWFLYDFVTFPKYVRNDSRLISPTWVSFER
jgi:hypothetical protein